LFVFVLSQPNGWRDDHKQHLIQRPSPRMQRSHVNSAYTSPVSLARRIELFVIAWRIANPGAEDTLATHQRIWRDAEELGVFAADPVSLSRDSVETYHTLLTDWKTSNPGYPQFRYILQRLIAAAEANTGVDLDSQPTNPPDAPHSR